MFWSGLNAFSTDMPIQISSVTLCLIHLLKYQDHEQWKIMMSSANSFTVDFMSTDRLLMYTRKKSGPKLDPCGTPAFTGNYSDI